MGRENSFNMKRTGRRMAGCLAWAGTQGPRLGVNCCSACTAQHYVLTSQRSSSCGLARVGPALGRLRSGGCRLRHLRKGQLGGDREVAVRWSCCFSSYRLHHDGIFIAAACWDSRPWLACPAQLARPRSSQPLGACTYLCRRLAGPVHRGAPPAYLEPRLTLHLLCVAVAVEGRACGSVRGRSCERARATGERRQAAAGDGGAALAGAPARCV